MKTVYDMSTGQIIESGLTNPHVSSVFKFSR